MLGKLVLSGMNIVRMNFSHGSQDFHQRTMDNLRGWIDGCSAGSRKPIVAVMLDTKGPEIRTGKLKENLDSVTLQQGQEFTLYCDPKEYEGVRGDEKGVTVSYERLHEKVAVGDTVMIDDGLLCCTVTGVSGTNVVLRLENSGTPIARQFTVPFPPPFMRFPFPFPRL